MLPAEVVLPDIPTMKYFLAFPQPNRNYSAFMDQLWKQKVCLEEAKINNDIVSGTIKVINLAFKKEVEIKITYDLWHSYTIFKAKYLSSDSVQIDTFSFQFNIPPRTNSVKFCIRYTCDGNEFWDNNENIDYSISATFVPKGS